MEELPKSWREETNSLDEVGDSQSNSRWGLLTMH
jgi:hypothetical protein